MKEHLQEVKEKNPGMSQTELFATVAKMVWPKRGEPPQRTDVSRRRQEYSFLSAVLRATLTCPVLILPASCAQWQSSKERADGENVKAAAKVRFLFFGAPF